MIKTKKFTTAEEIADAVIEGILEKKGKDIQRLDLRGVEKAVCDFMIVCHGDSDRQVGAIADSVEDVVRENLKEKPSHVEGKSEGEWVLLDYFSVIVHVFKLEQREFYGVEDLWGDADVKSYQTA
ncbi:MAG: ribosome-associated protein [Sphingobacteriales bacterium]|jgi:ribosome-associated protein